MQLKEIGEFGFINKISAGCLIREESVVKAIGDDAAVFRSSPEKLTLLTTDLLVERVHFLRSATTGFNLGYKSLAVNLSDIAAMGGVAREAFVSIAIPEDCPVGFLEDLYNGMKSLAQEFEVNILGGDTTSSKTDLVINVAVTGEVASGEMLSRDSASEGDLIFSTGFLGDSRAGLHLILNNLKEDYPEFESLFKAHILPRPHLTEGRFLAKQGAKAGIDVSDGLSSDLGHILKASNVGARLYADKIPLSDELQEFCKRFEFDPVDYALKGGEDYTLIVTIAKDRSDKMEKMFEQEFNSQIFCIGEITEGHGLELIMPDGQKRDNSPKGWDHFL